LLEFNDVICIADTNVNTTMTDMPQVVYVVSSRTHTDTEQPSYTRVYLGYADDVVGDIKAGVAIEVDVNR